jgi:hypothetical protein
MEAKISQVVSFLKLPRVILLPFRSQRLLPLQSMHQNLELGIGQIIILPLLFLESIFQQE